MSIHFPHLIFISFESGIGNENKANHINTSSKDSSPYENQDQRTDGSIGGYDADEDSNCGSDKENDYVLIGGKECQKQSTKAMTYIFPASTSSLSSKKKVRFNLNHRSDTRFSAQEAGNDVNHRNDSHGVFLCLSF